MRVLVTGGTGFTGTALSNRLVKEGHQVVALDTKEGIACEQLRAKGVDVRLGSVTDPAFVVTCVNGVDFVFHLAAAFREVGVPESHYDEVDVQGTVNVLEAAHRVGVKKFVYCSTCGVHGNVENPPANEDAPIAPADYYQRTKYLSEPIVAEYQTKGMVTTILRSAAIYGPGDPERFSIVPPIFPRRVDWYRQNRAFDISRAKAELGYVARIGLPEGLARTAVWYRENGYL